MDAIGFVLLIVAGSFPLLLLEPLQDVLPEWLAVPVAASTAVPVGFALFFVMWFFASRRDHPRFARWLGSSWHGALFAQAAVFFYAPMVVHDEYGSLRLPTVVFSWACAAACVWAGFKVKQHAKAKLDLALLAAATPSLATRFLVQPDRRAWPEIQPGNVAKYQAAFEACLAAIRWTPELAPHRLDDQQQRALVAAALDWHYRKNLYPGVSMNLTLAFLRAPDGVRTRDRAEWAAAVATNVDAQAIRDEVEYLTRTIFEKHRKTAA